MKGAAPDEHEDAAPEAEGLEEAAPNDGLEEAVPGVLAEPVANELEEAATEGSEGTADD